MRLIDANEARETMLKLLDHHLMMCNYSADSATQDCIDVINEAAVVDAEPVVRCKDCKWYRVDKHQCVHQICMLVFDDDFCSYGERKGGE